MSECVDANRVIGACGVERRSTLYVREGVADLSGCAYVVQTGPEFQKAQASQAEYESMLFPVAVVVIFVLGWIAGAQR